MNNIKLRNFDISNSSKLTLMGGMNVLESRDLALKVAEEFKTTCDRYNINYIFYFFYHFLFKIKSYFT